MQLISDEENRKLLDYGKLLGKRDRKAITLSREEVEELYKVLGKALGK